MGLLKRGCCQGGSDKLFAFSAYNCHRHWRFAVSYLGPLWAESLCVSKKECRLCTFPLALEYHSGDGRIGMVWFGVRLGGVQFEMEKFEVVGRKRK